LNVQFRNEVLEKVSEAFKLTYLKSYAQGNYLTSIRKFLMHYEETIKSEDEINLEKVKEYLIYLRHEKKLKIGTVNNYRSALKYLLTIVLKKDWCNKQIPCERGYKTYPNVLSHAQTMKLIEHTDAIAFKNIFLLMYSSGMRVSEVLNLRIADIDPNRMQIKIRQSKNGASRRAILSPKALTSLREYFKKHWLKINGTYDPEDFLFFSVRKNTRISSNIIGRELKKSLVKSCIQSKVTCHSLRHGFAVALMENGVPFNTIAELMGHRSLRSTRMYTKLADYSKMGIKTPLEYMETE
jgi:integrase/recombinase XerD